MNKKKNIVRLLLINCHVWGRDCLRERWRSLGIGGFTIVILGRLFSL